MLIRWSALKLLHIHKHHAIQVFNTLVGPLPLHMFAFLVYCIFLALQALTEHITAHNAKRSLGKLFRRQSHVKTRSDLLVTIDIIFFD